MTQNGDLNPAFITDGLLWFKVESKVDSNVQGWASPREDGEDLAQLLVMIIFLAGKSEIETLLQSPVAKIDPLSPNLPADLEIGEKKYSASVGDRCNSIGAPVIREVTAFKVRNNGPGTAPPSFKISHEFTDQPSFVETISLARGVEPGEAVVVTARPGSVETIVDPNDELLEEDETNNSAKVGGTGALICTDLLDFRYSAP